MIMESNVEECKKLEMEGGRFQILLCANKTELINNTECDLEEIYICHRVASKARFLLKKQKTEYMIPTRTFAVNKENKYKVLNSLNTLGAGLLTEQNLCTC